MRRVIAPTPHHTAHSACTLGPEKEQSQENKYKEHHPAHSACTLRLKTRAKVPSRGFTELRPTHEHTCKCNTEGASEPAPAQGPTRRPINRA